MEVDLLKQIVKNTEHKTSFQIIVSEANRDLTLDLIRRFGWIGIENTK